MTYNTSECPCSGRQPSGAILTGFEEDYYRGDYYNWPLHLRKYIVLKKHAVLVQSSGILYFLL